MKDYLLKPARWGVAIVTLSALLSSCALTRIERHENRGARKQEKLLKRHPELKKVKRIEITTPEHVVTGELQLGARPVLMDSLVKWLPIGDVPEPEIRRIIEKIPTFISAPPIAVNDERIHGRIWVDSGRIKYDITVKEQTAHKDVDVIQPTIHKPASKSVQRLIVVALLGFIIGLIIGLIIISRANSRK